MPPLDVLALVLAGGRGSRMGVLTQDRAKPALPFAGTYRLLDFSLSNLRHSGIDDVWVLVQFETQSILDVLAGGRPWDLDRSHGGLRIVPPQQESDEGEAGWHAGNAHALYANRRLIGNAAPELLLVMSADHVYKLDYSVVIDQHRRTGAEVTIVSAEVPVARAAHHALLEVSENGHVTGVTVKPEQPGHGVVATEVFVYDTAVALQVLEQLAGDGDGTSLQDFGDRLLPALIERGKAFDHRLTGYWKDLGRPEAYFEAHQDVLQARVRRRNSDLQLDDPAWPILTHDVPRMPAHLQAGAEVLDSLIGPACTIAGRVERSVLGPGTIVEAGALVADSVLLHDVVVRAGATLRHVIADDRTVIGANATVGEQAAGGLPTDGELVLLGADVRIDGGVRVPAGEQVDRGGRRRAS